MNLGAPWRPARLQMAAKIAQVSPKGSKKYPGRTLFDVLEASLLPRSFWVCFGLISINFNRLWHLVDSNSDALLAANVQTTKAAFHDDISHATQEKTTHNAARRTLLAIPVACFAVQNLHFGKMPRAAKNCQEPKANERRLLNYKLRVADHKTRSSATNASNNTGSAVLAPHGAFGFPLYSAAWRRWATYSRSRQY